MARKFNDKRMEKFLLNRGGVLRHGTFIDTYNQLYNHDVCGAIKTTIDRNNAYFICEVYEEDNREF